MRKIFSSIKEIKTNITNENALTRIVMASGGFDPIHIGHIRYIQDAKRTFTFEKILHDSSVTLVTIVNDDQFLINKKGKALMQLDERMEIVAAIEGVDYVAPWHSVDGDMTVCGAIELLQPDIFVKGGDKLPKNIPEWDSCITHNVKLLFNVGKVQSSSELVKQRSE